MRRVSQAVCLVSVVAASVSCASTVRQGRSPVYLIVNSLQGANGRTPTQFSAFLLSVVITNVITPAPCSATSPCPTVFNDPGQAAISLAMKDIGTPGNPSA